MAVFRRKPLTRAKIAFLTNIDLVLRSMTGGVSSVDHGVSLSHLLLASVYSGIRVSESSHERVVL